MLLSYLHGAGRIGLLRDGVMHIHITRALARYLVSIPLTLHLLDWSQLLSKLC
ncbi:hypothetical protein D3C80_2138970 [compost metagenome]